LYYKKSPCITINYCITKKAHVKGVKGNPLALDFVKSPYWATDLKSTCTPVILSSMNNNYIVCHARKIQTGVGLVNVCAHNSRLNIYDDAGELKEKTDWIQFPENGKFNHTERIPPEAILRHRNELLKTAEKKTVEQGGKWRKPQKNASTAIEFNLSASPEWFKNRSKIDVISYFDECRTFLEKKYGTENLLNWATHYDEKTPHMHILMAPLIKTDKGWKYSSSEFLGGRNGLRNLQEEIYQAVGVKNGLQRGLEGSAARHTDQVEYVAKIKKLEQDLEKDKRYASGFKDFISNKEIKFAFENGKTLKMKEGKKSLQKMDAQLEDFETLTPLGLEKLAKIMRTNKLEVVREAFEYQEKKGLKSIIEIPERRDNYISR